MAGHALLLEETARHATVLLVLMIDRGNVKCDRSGRPKKGLRMPGECDVWPIESKPGLKGGFLT